MQEILSKKEIGERIKSLRKNHGLSQSYIADILQLSRSNYSQIELGNQYPSFNTLHIIATYYRKTYDWLLHGYQIETEISQTTNSAKVIEPILTELNFALNAFSNSLKKLEEEISALKKSK